jgi:endonuclease/exonuclease/phosphatase family metal-dependent hydrolase
MAITARSAGSVIIDPRPRDLRSLNGSGCNATYIIRCAVCQVERPSLCKADWVELGEPMKIMTYNLRLAVEWDVHPWPERRPFMIELISDVGPAVLGTQEGLTRQLAELVAGLPTHYRWVGRSRDPGVDDEYCAVFYDSRRFQVLDMTQRWFSTTPDVPGSIDWGRHPRIMTAVTFREHSTGDEFLVINTHLDNCSAQARQFAANYLLAYIRATADGRPTILLGDFNTAARVSAVYRRLQETPLLDAFDRTAPQSQDRPTFNDYQQPATLGQRIDWIMVSPGIAVDECHVNTRNFNGLYPSDHLPVESTVRLPRALAEVGASRRLADIAASAKVPASR